MIESTRRSYIVAGIATAFLVGGACLLNVLLRHEFFYWDDVQHTFAPVFYLIGEHLRAGEWPISTLMLWQGGFLAGEGLYQLFNPISLATFWLLPSIDDVAIGMAVHAGVWLTLAGVGAHALAGRLGASPVWAMLAGFSYATSPFLVYWLAASWVNGAVGFAALPWCLFFLASRRFTWRTVSGLVFATYIVGVSGWIHAIAALVAFGACRILLPDPALSMRTRILIGCGLAAGALLASPQLLTTIAAVQGGMRPSTLSNRGMVVGSLQGLLTAFWPAYMQPTPWFRDDAWSPPLYYGAWFILPAAVAIRTRWRAFLGEFLWLAVPAAALLLATLGPDQLGATRWPLRLLPGALVAIIPLAAVAVSRHGRERARFSGRWAAAALAIAAVLTWQQHPDREAALLFLFMLILGMSMLVLRPDLPLSVSRRYAAAVAGTLLISLWMAAEYPVNGAFEDYFGPLHRSEVHQVGVRFPGSVVQVYSRGQEQDEKRSAGARGCKRNCPQPVTREESTWLPSGNMLLWRHERHLNGYTPAEMTSLKVMSCGQSIFGWTCDDPTATLLAREQVTQRPFIDLMRVDAVVVSARMPASLARFRSLHGWVETKPSGYVVVFRRKSVSTLPGTLSHLPEGVHVLSTQRASNHDEEVVLERPPEFVGGAVVFARARYPGHVITVDGRPARDPRIGGILVGVSLPAGQGPVTVGVRHELPFQALWRTCVGLGIALLLAALALAVLRAPTGASE